MVESQNSQTDKPAYRLNLRFKFYLLPIEAQNLWKAVMWSYRFSQLEFSIEMSAKVLQFMGLNELGSYIFKHPMRFRIFGITAKTILKPKDEIPWIIRIERGGKLYRKFVSTEFISFFRKAWELSSSQCQVSVDIVTKCGHVTVYRLSQNYIERAMCNLIWAFMFNEEKYRHCGELCHALLCNEHVLVIINRTPCH